MMAAAMLRSLVGRPSGRVWTALRMGGLAVGLILIKHSTAVEDHLPLHRKRFLALGFLFLIVNASLIVFEGAHGSSCTCKPPKSH